jgi:1-phosphofructokinase family hexose kinase
MIVSVAPSPALDRTLVVDAVSPGHIHRPTAVVAVAGGKGFNVARAAHMLGADVVGCAILGGPTGEVVRRLLADEGLRACVVDGRLETRTCTSVADATTGAMTEFYEAATAVSAREWVELEQAVARELDQRPGWLTISGSMPVGAPIEAVARLTHLAHGRGARVAVDTHGPALAAALDERPDIVKVNVHEAAQVLAVDLPDARSAAVALHDRRTHGWLTVVTAGIDGAYALTDDGLWHVGTAARGAYAQGSGDSFLAGLVQGLVAYRDDVAAALALATGTASANAQEPGAAVFDVDLARTLARRVEVTT